MLFLTNVFKNAVIILLAADNDSLALHHAMSKIVQRGHRESLGFIKKIEKYALNSK